MGSLILAGHELDGSLRYIGCVGTGFTECARSALCAALDQLARADPPLHSVRRRLHGRCVGAVVADIQRREVSEECILRHPSFRGFRTDLDPVAVMVPACWMPKYSAARTLRRTASGPRCVLALHALPSATAGQRRYRRV
ncbi:ATP dependent DNA ligase [Nocardia niigatensis]